MGSGLWQRRDVHTRVSDAERDAYNKARGNEEKPGGRLMPRSWKSSYPVME